ncbi:MAG: transketolase, partial [Balneolales bacterium]|nr:transketolase [Balneolales bacterium]
YSKKHPALAKQFLAWTNRELPENWFLSLPDFEADEKGMATRASSGKVLNAIKDTVPNMLGGSADLEGSVKTNLSGAGVFSSDDYSGRNTHYGVREHAMAAALNGMALHGGVIPFGGTFFVFTDYCRPSIRLAALMKVPSIFVMTHDSIGLGEDGPTHQPVEHLASLRAMPNVLVLRPGDANEVSYAWKKAIENKTGPTVLVLTRQAVPTLERGDNNPASLLEKGAYVYSDSEKEVPDCILIGTGSELHLAVNAKTELKARGVDARVVSMPSWELFEQQAEEYKESILPKTVINRVSIEAGSTFGWVKYVGLEGKSVGIDSFGESGPAGELFKHFGITTEKMVEVALD